MLDIHSFSSLLCDILCVLFESYLPWPHLVTVSRMTELQKSVNTTTPWDEWAETKICKNILCIVILICFKRQRDIKTFFFCHKEFGFLFHTLKSYQKHLLLEYYSSAEDNKRIFNF